jgi:UDP-N-acetylglucosamine:LPS N-acetylglucosamine transferase
MTYNVTPEPLQARDKISLRKQLGLHLGVKTVLVMGGGDGIGKLDKIAYSLAENLSHNVEESQMVVVCGKNEKMRSQLEGHQWPSNVHVVICGKGHRWLHS